MDNTMHLLLSKFDERNYTTISSLQLDGKHRCWILEDQWLEKKVMGQTRIPAGSYEIIKRFVGKYARRSKRGYSLEVSGIPNYSAVLFHPGNDHGDTAGCLLPGTYLGVKQSGDYWVVRSKDAFTPIEDEMCDALDAGIKVILHVSR